MLKGTQAEDPGERSQNRQVGEALLSGVAGEKPSLNPKGDREKLLWVLGEWRNLGLYLGSVSYDFDFGHVTLVTDLVCATVPLSLNENTGGHSAGPP